MVDAYSNGGSKRSPGLDLNQALTKEDEEEEKEPQKELLGPSWLFAKPQKPWLHLNEQDLADHKDRTLEAHANRTSSPEPHRALPDNPHYSVEQHGLDESSIVLYSESQDLALQDVSTVETEQRFQVIDIWKTNTNKTMDLTKSFLPFEDVKQSRDNLDPTLETDWEQEPVALPRMQRSLSPVSPPLGRKSLSPVSPVQRLPEEVRGAAPQRGRSPTKRGSSYRSPPRGHNSGNDAHSRKRRDRDDSLSPRTLSKRRRDRSPSRSPIGRSHRVGRRRSRSPGSHGYRYSSPRSRYSPGQRYSPRRRSPGSHRPKRRPWSPPPNRNTGLGKPGRNLFIAGFSFGTTERDLERKFSRYGHVRDVRIVRDKRSGDSRGFGFLSLDRDENADAAIRGLDQTEWNGRIVLVEKAKSPN